jgi:hypothetical protein
VGNNKVISSLCYFSVFFAGFIFPIAVYFIVNDPEVKKHAKSAFLSHLIPVLTIPVLVFLGISAGMSGTDGMMIFMFIGFALAGIVNLIVIIWNVIKGIKILREA